MIGETPYDVESWYRFDRDAIYVKIRKPPEEGKPKKGFIVRLSMEVVEQYMEEVLPGAEYPEAPLQLVEPEIWNR